MSWKKDRWPKADRQASKPSFKYAFRIKGTEDQFWDGYMAERVASAWKPTIVDSPRFWLSKFYVDRKMDIWEMERLSGRDLPEIEVIPFEMLPQQKEAEVYTPDISKLREEWFERTIGKDGIAALQKVKTLGRNPEEYRYAIRRTGEKKTIEDLLPDAVTYGTITLVRTDNEVLQAKLALSEGNFKRHFDLQFPKVK